MPKFLVTGGCGFIGSHLGDALQARGNHVRVLDDLSTGSEANLPKGAEFLRGSICNPGIVGEALAGMDGCFHLAAIASVEQGVRRWRQTHEVNLSGTVTILEAAAALAPPIPVVYASSAAVYGNCAATVLNEDTPTRPLSAYGADKLGCELHARVAGDVHGVPTMGLRFFNVFGPRQDPRSPYSGVISIFCDRLLHGNPVDIYGDGLQTRDFVHVSDVVAALLGAMERASLDAPVLNVCTGRPTAVRDLAEKIGILCGRAAQIRLQPPRTGEVRHSLGSPERARAQLGLLPATSLEDGLASLLEWLRLQRASAPPSTSPVSPPC